MKLATWDAGPNASTRAEWGVGTAVAAQQTIGHNASARLGARASAAGRAAGAGVLTAVRVGSAAGAELGAGAGIRAAAAGAALGGAAVAVGAMAIGGGCSAVGSAVTSGVTERISNFFLRQKKEWLTRPLCPLKVSPLRPAISPSM